MPRRGEPALTTTSYALLAQLAQRPWAAYELAVGQERHFRFCWPRAARALYNELRRLDALGLATAQTTFVGRRSRTVYSLTAAGRDALRTWLDTSVSPLALEFEGLLRVLSAPLGTREELLATLDRIRADVAEMTAHNDGVIDDYARGRSPFQHEAHLRTLALDFVTQFLDVTGKWAERTIAEVEAWEDLSPAGKPLTTLERLHRQRHAAR